ncbi:MAG: type II toxin-antitoxin system VapB family antitoxin [Candidatus Methylomirabilis sp.]
MRTTLDLDEGLVKELVKVTKAKTKTKAIHIAIREFIRRRKLEGLKALSGKIRLDLDWRALEEVEIKDQERQQRQWRDRR